MLGKDFTSELLKTWSMHLVGVLMLGKDFTSDLLKTWSLHLVGVLMLGKDFTSELPKTWLLHLVGVLINLVVQVVNSRDPALCVAISSFAQLPCVWQRFLCVAATCDGGGRVIGVWVQRCCGLFFLHASCCSILFLFFFRAVIFLV